MKRFSQYLEEDAPTNATGTAVPGTGDDDSTVVVKKKPKIYKRKRRMSAEQIEEVQRNYRKEYDNYHSKPEQREKNAARLRARRLMIKNGKAARGDGKDVHHKDNNPLNNDETNLKLTDPSWNRREPRLRKEGLGEGLKMNDPKLNKLFDKLKKGDTVTIEYTSAMSRGKDTFKVTAKNVVGKMRVEKITLRSVKNPKSVKHYLYKRDTGVTMAQGDMATSIESIKEEIKEIINIDERELSPTELKRREEIAQKIDDSEMKKKYGERWKSVKMAIATKVAKNESIFEAEDPKADAAKEKELKIARAIAQAQLEIAKAQERVQQLTKVQQKLKDSQKTEETMTEKYLKSKSGSLEDTILSVWKAGANVAQADTPTTPEVEEATDAEATTPKKIDGRTKEYKETLKRISMRKERLNKKSTVKEEDELEEGKKFRDGDIKKAIKIAYDMEGNMTGAFKKIEKIKRGLADEPTVKAALQDANEEVVHEAVKGHFDAMDNKEMEKSLKKFRLKGKIVTKDVNPGVDEWEVTGKSIEDVWKWYTKSGYGNAGDFEDMDDFKDTHFESREHHRNMMTEGSKEEYEKFFQAALKKFGVKSPSELEGEKKKEFFDYVDKNWKGDDEKSEEVSEGTIPPALKKAIETIRARKQNINEGTYIFPILDSEGESERGAKQQLAKASKFGVKGKIVKDKYNDDGGSAVEVSGSPEDVIRWQWDMSPNEKISSSDVKDLEKNQGKSKYRGGKDMSIGESIRPTAKKSAVSDKDIEKFERGGGKVKKLKPGGRMKGMEKKRKDVVKGRRARGEEVQFESMDIIRKIAANKESAEIDGHKVDVYSASAMCRVFDNLSHANQQKVEQMLKSKKGINTFAEFSIANI